jgi:hypothetical protein
MADEMIMFLFSYPYKQGSKDDQYYGSKVNHRIIKLNYKTNLCLCEGYFIPKGYSVSLRRQIRGISNLDMIGNDLH